MFEDGFLRLAAADRLAEAERIGERARLLGRPPRRPGLWARLRRLLAAVGAWRAPEPRGRAPAADRPGRLPLALLTLRR